MIKIDIFTFLYYLIIYWSIDAVINKIISYKKIESDDIEINAYIFKIYICLTKKTARMALSKKSDGELTYVNKSFTNSHGHFYGIGNLDSNTNLWNVIHKGLAQSIVIDDLKKIMDNNLHILTYKYGFKYNINNVLAEYILTIWGQFCFGFSDDENMKLFMRLRTLLIDTLHKTFYNCKTNYIPIIGPHIATLRRFVHKREFKEIDEILSNLINNEKLNGFIHKFKNLIDKTQYSILVKQKIVLDNAFLSILAFDFIYVFLLETLLQIAQKNINHFDYEINYEKTEAETLFQRRLNLKDETIKTGFLFPYRMRRINDNNGFLRIGDFVIINLIKSELYFSYGPRMCIGYTFMNNFYKHFLQGIDKYNIKKLDSNQIIRSPNKNIPLIISEHNIELEIPKNKLNDMLENFSHKGMTNFYRIEGITEKTDLYNYFCCKIADIIKDIERDTKIDYLIFLESRGFLFSSISFITKIPFVVIRKHGKISGPVISESYKKAYDASEIIDMSIFSPIYNNKSNIIIIDDGIASGETIHAACKIIEKCEGNILRIIVGIKHLYVKHHDLKYKLNYLFEL